MAQRPTLALSVAAIVAFLSSQASASAISTSVFPNSACAGSSTGAGLVGIGKVTLSNGEVETHCGCPSDNLPSFEACPASANGESVCNSVLDLETGAFTASCGVVPCQGSACPKTVVNTVVVDDADCFASGKGALGISTVEGQSKCSCASEAEDFQACPSAANGRASCVSVDNDFLGVAYSNKETVQCGVVCEEGFYLTPSGTCTKLSKRDNIYGSAGPIKVGPSMSNGPHRSTGRTHAPHTGATTTTGGVFSTTGPGKNVPTTSYGSHSGHHTHHHSHHGSHTGSHSGSITTSASQSGSTSGSYSASHSKHHGHHTHHHSHHNSHHNSHHGSHTTSASESTSTPHGSHTGGSHSASHTHHHHGHHSGSHSGSHSASHSGHHSHHHSGHHSMSTTTGPSVPTTTIHLTGSIKIGSTTSARTISSHSHARHSHSGHHSGHHGSHTGSHSGFHTTTASASTTGTPGSHTGSHSASHSGHHGHHHSHSGHHSGHHGSHSGSHTGVHTTTASASTTGTPGSHTGSHSASHSGHHGHHSHSGHHSGHHGSHTGSTSGVFSTTGVTKIVTTTSGTATGSSHASSSTHGSMRHGGHHHGHHTHQPHGPHGSASASASMSTPVRHPKPINTEPGHHNTRVTSGWHQGGITNTGVFSPTTTPVKIGGSTTAASSGPSASSRFRARSAPEIVFGSDVCASDERSCASGDFGDFTCVRLDDVTECGGCHSTGDATNCMEIPGILTASCLRGGCVVRACQSGWYQTSEGSCAQRA